MPVPDQGQAGLFPGPSATLDQCQVGKAGLLQALDGFLCALPGLAGDIECFLVSHVWLVEIPGNVLGIEFLDG